jgi:hypothetical protein
LAGSLHPIWLKHTSEADLLTLKLIDKESPVAGTLVLVLMLIIAAIAWWTRRHELAVSAGIGALCSVSVVLTLSTVPRSLFVPLRYLHFFLWPIGILLWIIVGWATVEVGRTVSSHVLHARSALHASSGGSSAKLPRLRHPVYAIALIACFLVVGGLSLRGLLNPDSEQGPPVEVTLDRHAVTLVETEIPRGKVSILLQWGSVKDSPLNVFGYSFELGTGIAWQLTADGWQPALPSWLSNVTGVSYPRHSDWPTVTVTMDPNKVTVARTSD